jgi:hypothetical protein
MDKTKGRKNMRLYRTRVEPDNRDIGANRTLFNTSLVKAKQTANQYPDCNLDIAECTVFTDLKAQEWVALLEMDSPGQQEGMTPVDFISEVKLIWTQERKTK